MMPVMESEQLEFAQALINEVCASRKPHVERLLSERADLSEDAKTALRELRCMPHGNEWRWLDRSNRWRVATVEQLEWLGSTIREDRQVSGPVHAAHSFLRIAADLLVAEFIERSWESSSPMQVWEPDQLQDGQSIEVDDDGNLLRNGVAVGWKIDDVEARSQAAAVMRQWGTWELCELGLDGSTDALDAVISIFEIEGWRPA